MRITESRFLSPMALRDVCIKHGWYTHGTNADYEHLLFDLTKGGSKNLTTDDLAAIAADIKLFSDVGDYRLVDIMFAVCEKSVTVFEEEAEIDD